ncbi:hypothetical protein [Massilia eburnea]|uniref:hypothetical protein n=1 Tax=Massilia eburnea TaxID=1776165 RepID=UPI003D6B8D63
MPEPHPEGADAGKFDAFALTSIYFIASYLIINLNVLNISILPAAGFFENGAQSRVFSGAQSSPIFVKLGSIVAK